MGYRGHEAEACDYMERLVRCVFKRKGRHIQRTFVKQTHQFHVFRKCLEGTRRTAYNVGLGNGAEHLVVISNSYFLAFWFS